MEKRESVAECAERGPYCVVSLCSSSLVFRPLAAPGGRCSMREDLKRRREKSMGVKGLVWANPPWGSPPCQAH
jgi:hypothetical protein